MAMTWPDLAPTDIAQAVLRGLAELGGIAEHWQPRLWLWDVSATELRCLLDARAEELSVYCRRTLDAWDRQRHYNQWALEALGNTSEVRPALPCPKTTH